MQEPDSAASASSRFSLVFGLGQLDAEGVSFDAEYALGDDRTQLITINLFGPDAPQIFERVAARQPATRRLTGEWKLFAKGIGRLSSAVMASGDLTRGRKKAPERKG